MERKTTVSATAGRHDLLITREFELPAELVFRAYSEAELLEQWMGTKVIKLDNHQHGGWQFETCDPKGNVVFKAHGSIHDIVPGQKIVRTFEMANAPFGVQLEVLEFERVSEEKSLLKIRTVFETIEQRDQMLKLPFAYGLNMAHNTLETMATQLK